jgi:F0F1-type ATP synthase membrane subunit b/b'
LPDDASLHKIREILVGPTTRSVDERLDAFKKQIETANQKSQQEFGTRLEALEKQLRSGLDHQKELSEQAQKAFESKLDEMRKQTGTAVERIAKAHGETREWIERELEALRTALDTAFESFRVDFVDRPSMSSLFSEMSFRVASQMGGPVDATEPDGEFEVVTDLPKKKA